MNKNKGHTIYNEMGRKQFVCLIFKNKEGLLVKV